MIFSMHTKAQALRQLFKAQTILRVMGAHNGLGAKLIEKNGFDAVWASGLEISTAHAVPDANILTMTENLNAASAINEAMALPVICDCDTGYGNAMNVRRMVKKYEAAGLAAAVIEDKLFPKLNSFIPGRQELATVEEFMGKIEAAKNAQTSPDFMIFARVEALIAGWGIDEALRRAYAYEEAGADGIVIHSKAKTPDEIFNFSAKWKGAVPLIAIPTTYYDVTAEALAARGFRMVIYANQGLRASIRAMNEVFKSIRETGSTAFVERRIAPMREVFEIQGMMDMKDEEKKFSKRKSLAAVIPAAGDHRFQSGLAQILSDRPLCMLEIGGKTLVDRQADILRSCGVQDIYVVGGYRSEKIRAEGASLLENPRYAETGNAYSVLLAQGHLRDRCIMVYSDIVFDRRILEELLKSPHEVTLVIDRAYRALPFREKKLDLVIAESQTRENVSRKLDLNLFKPVRRIGRQIDKREANYEFIGMAFFREEGLQALKRAWAEAQGEFRGRPFYEAESVEKADFNDLIQYLIDRGTPVHGLEIEQGWSEIHSLDDYKRVRSHFEEKSEAKVLSGL